MRFTNVNASVWIKGESVRQSFPFERRKQIKVYSLKVVQMEFSLAKLGPSIDPVTSLPRHHVFQKRGQEERSGT